MSCYIIRQQNESAPVRSKDSSWSPSRPLRDVIELAVSSSSLSLSTRLMMSRFMMISWGALQRATDVLWSRACCLGNYKNGNDAHKCSRLQLQSTWFCGIMRFQKFDLLPCLIPCDISVWIMSYLFLMFRMLILLDD